MFKIIRNDITKMDVECIVNAANESLLGGGGVDGAIHKAAGPMLYEECKKLGGCKTGEAKITRAYNLKAKHIIHTVGPIYKNGKYHEEDDLRSCYKKSLELAKIYNIKSIAFPLISAGIYAYPKDEALNVATDEISKFLINEEMDVYLVLFDKKSVLLGTKLYKNIKSYIDDNCVNELETRYSRITCSVCESENSIVALDDIFEDLDESFNERLFRLIDLKGMNDVEVYKRANIDRKLFSKIKTNKNYHPSKETIIALAISLRLNLDETNGLLESAGYILSHSSKFDVIIEYFIKHKNYNIFEINETLYSFDQKLLI